MKLIKNKLLIIIAIIFLTSCTTAVNVTSSSIKEKGIKEAISDGMIDASINKQFLNHDLNMFVNVEIEVVEGRVLLTGSVKKTKHRLDAIKLSWKVLGVREVINEIDVSVPKWPVASNFTGFFHEEDSSKIKQNLINQIEGSVKWVQNLKELSKMNFEGWLDVGPGKVLFNMVPKADVRKKINHFQVVGDIIR